MSGEASVGGSTCFVELPHKTLAGLDTVVSYTNLALMLYCRQLDMFQLFEDVPPLTLLQF